MTAVHLGMYTVQEQIFITASQTDHLTVTPIGQLLHVHKVHQSIPRKAQSGIKASMCEKRVRLYWISYAGVDALVWADCLDAKNL